MHGCFVNRLLLIVCLLGIPALASSTSSRIDVSEFSTRGLEDWISRSFKGSTSYEVIQTGDGAVLSARSQAAASGLKRMIQVDLTETPFLNWSWRVNDAPQGLREQTREGDDYAARVYVLDGSPFSLLPDRSLNYVWSANQTTGSTWVSAYSNKVWMVAVRGAEHHPGVWHHEKRNVREDFQRLFGKDVTSVEAVAVMTDTDNSGLEADALYGEIYFTAE